MTIITQSDTDSKYEYSPDLVSEVTHEATSGSGYKRTLQYREWRNRAAAALFEAGYEDDALLFMGCAELPKSSISSDTKVLPHNAETIWVCDHDNFHEAMLFFATCGSRGCPDCAHRQVARFARRFVTEVLLCAERKGYNRLRHIVLTTAVNLNDTDCKQKVAEYWSAVGKLWKLLEKKSSKWTTEGTIEAFEFGENGLMLHFHIIHYGRYLPQSAISEAWHTLTGGEAVVTYVRGIGADTDATADEIANEVIETLKYSVKFWSTDKDGNVSYIDPELMPKLLAVLKGKRRVRSRGCFYNIKEPPKEPLCCATCGNEMLRVGVVFFPIWQATGFSPEEYKSALDSDRLHLILANKSVKAGNGNNKSPPVQGRLWPDTTTHYDAESSRKAF